MRMGVCDACCINKSFSTMAKTSVDCDETWCGNDELFLASCHPSESDHPTLFQVAWCSCVDKHFASPKYIARFIQDDLIHSIYVAVPSPA